MAGPEDYMGGSRGPFPASYVAPLIGPQLGDRLAGLPEQYFQGTQRERALELQKPIIDPATGQPSVDMGQILQEANRRGGLDYAVKLLPFLQRRELANQDRANWEQLYGPNSGAAPPPIRAPGQRSEATPSTGTALSPDSGAADTVRSVATETFPNRDVSLAIPRYASQIGVGADDPLTPEQVRQLRARMGGDRTTVPSDNAPGRVGGSEMNQPARTSYAAEASNNAVRGGDGAPPPESAGVSGAPGPIASPPTSAARVPVGPGAPTQAAEPAAGGGNLTPRPQRVASATPNAGLMPPPGQPPAAAGGGAPTPQPQVAQAGPPPRTPVVPGQRPATAQDASMVPPALAKLGVTNQRYADWLMAQARQHAIMGDNEGAKNYQEMAKPIYDLIKSQATPTDLQKNVSSGAERDKALQDAMVKRSEAQYNGINASAQGYERDMRPMIQLSRSILNDPKIYTGTGGDVSLMINRAKAIYGDKEAAQLQEVLQKVTAIGVLNQINQQRFQLMEAGGQSARIFAATVDQIEKSVVQLGTTTSGNRALVEISDRMGHLNSIVAQRARDYMARHGGLLDQGFDQELSQFLQKAPVFTPQELAKPSRLGVPEIPQHLTGTRGQVDKWAIEWALKPGDEIRKPDGSYTAWKGTK